MGGDVVVVGAGVGGLAAAIDLAIGGCRVTVIEREERIGGKLAFVELAGQSIDVGPTVFTMRWVFDALFASASRRLDDYADLVRVDVLARHAWPDGVRLDLFSDGDRSEAAIAEALGPSEARSYRRFLGQAKAIYDVVEGPFLRSQRPDWTHAMREVRTLGLGALLRVDALRTMARSLDQTFGTPHLRQLFGRYATYCGSSPFEAPSTFNLIAYVETLGIHRVVGGMRAFGDALARLAHELGVDIRLGSRVERIVVRNGVARGVALEGGRVRDADAVVFAGDISALGSGLLGPDAAVAVRPTAPAQRSFSAMTWAIVAESSGFPLLHHNVFFCTDAAAEFRALADSRRIADEPTVYVCAQDSPEGTSIRREEPLLLVVNAPPTGDAPSMWNEEVMRKCERTVFSVLERCGLSLARKATVRTTPVDFEKRFPATGGALYGARMSGAFSPLARPGAKSRLPGLYLAGGSVHPGPGVPMSALSGRFAASRVLEGLGSTRPSPRVAISGTTSMP